MKYTASIQHNEASMSRMTTVQYNTYNRKTKYTIMIAGIAAIFGSVFTGFSTSAGILLLFVGCWALASVNYPARSMAKKLYEAYKNDLPWAKYSIAEDGFWVTSGSGTWKVEYDDIYSLVEDKENFYVFINTQSLHMLPKASVGEGTVEGLKAFLEKKTGKKFGPVGGMLRIRKNVFYFIKKKMDEKAAGKGSEE